jgi:hypothetical protein
MGNAQRLLPDTIHKINVNFHYKPKVKIQNLLYVKYSGLFSVAMNVNVNKKAFKTQDLEQNMYNAMQYDLKTKLYINKRVSVIVRTQLSAVSNIASFGLSFKLR